MFPKITITGVFLVPLVIALAVQIGLDPWMLTSPVAIVTSPSFLLVTSSLANLISDAYDYFSIRDFARAEPLNNTLCSPVILIIAYCLLLTIYSAIGANQAVPLDYGELLADFFNSGSRTDLFALATTVTEVLVNFHRIFRF